MDCKYCGQNYSSKGGLSVHIKRVHEKSTIVWVSSFKIELCFEKYKIILFFKEVSFILHPDEKYFFLTKSYFDAYVRLRKGLVGQEIGEINIIFCYFSASYVTNSLAQSRFCLNI